MNLTATEFATHPKFALDLTRYQFRRASRGVVIYGTWYGREREPAMVLLPQHSESVEQVTPAVIPLSQAHVWEKPSTTAGAILALEARAARIADALGWNGNDLAARLRVVSIIRDNISDLLTMAPVPSSETDVAAYATVTDADGRTHESEILDYV